MKQIIIAIAFLALLLAGCNVQPGTAAALNSTIQGAIGENRSITNETNTTNSRYANQFPNGLGDNKSAY